MQAQRKTSRVSPITVSDTHTINIASVCMMEIYQRLESELGQMINSIDVSDIDPIMPLMALLDTQLAVLKDKRSTPEARVVVQKQIERIQWHLDWLEKLHDALRANWQHGAADIKITHEQSMSDGTLYQTIFQIQCMQEAQASEQSQKEDAEKTSATTQLRDALESNEAWTPSYKATVMHTGGTANETSPTPGITKRSVSELMVLS